MPARTGQEYIEAISAAEITVEIHGERTTGKVAEIPAFKNRDPAPTRRSTTSSTSPGSATS